MPNLTDDRQLPRMKDTKYWIRRDIETIKSSIQKVVKLSLYTLPISFLLMLFLSSFQFEDLITLLLKSLLIYCCISLVLFVILVFKNKGYTSNNFLYYPDYKSTDVFFPPEMKEDQVNNKIKNYEQIIKDVNNKK